MSELEKLLSGKNGAKELVRVLESLDKVQEGINELDGLPDDNKKKVDTDGDGVADTVVDKDVDAAPESDDAELTDSDMDDIENSDDDTGNGVLDDLKDVFVDFAIDLATMGNDDLIQLLNIKDGELPAGDPVAPTGDIPNEDGNNMTPGDAPDASTTADLGDQPNDGLKKPEEGSADPSDQGSEDPEALKKEIAQKDAKIKELEAQLANQ